MLCHAYGTGNEGDSCPNRPSGGVLPARLGRKSGGMFSTPLAEGGAHMALTLTEANRMIQAAVAKAQELNGKISVAVCDTGGIWWR